MDDTCAASLGDLLRSVVAAVVRYDDLAAVLVVGEALLGGADAAFEGLRFVQTRKHEAHFEGQRLG